MAHDLHPARLRAKKEAGGGLWHVEIEPTTAAARSYERPGQYVSLRAADKTAYFVLAGDPGEPRWEFLLRPGGEAADRILALAAGDDVEATNALGAGFPIDEARGEELILAATGSGIAAVRPVVRRRVRDEEAGSTELYLGVRTPSDIPLVNELAEWSSAGVDVRVCLSQAPAEDRWQTRGYVQDVARTRARRPIAKRRIVFAAGVKGMIEGMRSLARDIGVHESDVRTNY